MALFESERKIMEVLWSEGKLKASELAKILNKNVGWSRNTTYTVLNKCVEKKLVKREEPGYVVSPLVSRKQIQREDTANLLDNSFNGSVVRLMAAVFDVTSVSKYEIKEIKRLLGKRA